MSKRLGNVVDPFETLNIFGPDATRWYLISNASPWDNLKFDIEGIKEVQRKFFGTLYNTYQFFALYANVDGFHFQEKTIPYEERPEMDRWILSSLNSLIKIVVKAMDDYEATQAARAIENFVGELLSNWFVRLSRRRFWKPSEAGNGQPVNNDKLSAYQTLYECLETLSLLMAPIAPFFAEWLFNDLNKITGRFKVTSVHHLLYPQVTESHINIVLQERMELAQEISSLILSLRKKVNIKVRQPLQKALIPAVSEDLARKIKSVEEIIKAETNIKEIELLDANNDVIRKKAKANFKTLGKKLGPKMKWAAEEIQKMNNSAIGEILNGPYLLNPTAKENNEELIYISIEDIDITTDHVPGYEVASKGNLTVALDIIIDEVLKNEGNARELINRIQNLRKDLGLEVTDKIVVKVSGNLSDLDYIFENYYTYICAEILAESLDFHQELSVGQEIEVNDTIIKVHIIKKID